LSFTLSTVPLTFLALYLCYRAKWRFLPVAMFMSVFQAASILNVGGSIGIGISYVLLMLALAKGSFSPRPQARSLCRGNRIAGTLVALFILYATASAFFSPLVFQGTLYTNPKVGFGVPLTWETSHLNQLAYLILCGALFFIVSYRTPASELRRSVDWYIAGNLLASLIAIYQFVCLRTGLPFPSHFLYTNPVYGIFEAYDISGFARVNSTFVEASSAAGFLTPALAILFWRLLVKPTRKDGAYSIVIFGGLFLTISTTGYICFGFLLCIALVVYLFKWKGRAQARVTKLVFGAALAASIVALLGTPIIFEKGSDLLDLVIFSKPATFSYEQRSEMNNDALKTASDTAWLGAGFGVCRASGLLPTLLGNVGIPGVALFALLLVQVFRPAWRSKRHDFAFQGQLVFASAVLVFGLLVSGPEITSPPMWLFFAGATTTLPHFIHSPLHRPAFINGREHVSARA
jgi:hypothetical protein